MLLCEAAGYENILVETVGVGQSETAVHDMVDFFLLISIAGAGDELQGMKRGVMELADLVAINKADGANVRAAERARSEAQNALHYLPASQSGWSPRAVTCSARTCEGIAELWDCVAEYVALTRDNGWFTEVRKRQAQAWMQEIISESLRQRFESQPTIKMRRQVLEKDVIEGRITSFRAARELLEAHSRE
jgi:LAO/AO transport system kinase